MFGLYVLHINKRDLALGNECRTSNGKIIHFCLVRAFEENQDERSMGVVTWALGCMGGSKAKQASELFYAFSSASNPRRNSPIFGLHIRKIPFLKNKSLVFCIITFDGDGSPVMVW